MIRMQLSEWLADPSAPKPPYGRRIRLIYPFWSQVRPANENLTARGIEWRERRRKKWREAKRRWRAKKRLAEQAEAEWELPELQRRTPPPPRLHLVSSSGPTNADPSPEGSVQTV
jgi:hypothetical protein